MTNKEIKQELHRICEEYLFFGDGLDHETERVPRSLHLEEMARAGYALAEKLADKGEVTPIGRQGSTIIEQQ